MFKKKNLTILIASIMCMSAISFSNVSAMNIDNLSINQENYRTMIKIIKSETNDKNQSDIDSIKNYNNLISVMTNYYNFISSKIKNLYYFGYFEKNVTLPDRKILRKEILGTMKDIANLLRFYYIQNAKIAIIQKKIDLKGYDIYKNLQLNSDEQNEKSLIKKMNVGSKYAEKLKDIFDDLMKALQKLNDPIIDYDKTKKVENKINETIKKYAKEDTVEQKQCNEKIIEILTKQIDKLLKEILTENNMEGVNCYAIYTKLKKDMIYLQKKLIEGCFGEEYTKSLI